MAREVPKMSHYCGSESNDGWSRMRDEEGRQSSDDSDEDEEGDEETMKEMREEVVEKDLEDEMEEDGEGEDDEVNESSPSGNVQDCQDEEMDGEEEPKEKRGAKDFGGEGGRGDEEGGLSEDENLEQLQQRQQESPEESPEEYSPEETPEESLQESVEEPVQQQGRTTPKRKTRPNRKYLTAAEDDSAEGNAKHNANSRTKHTSSQPRQTKTNGQNQHGQRSKTKAQTQGDRADAQQGIQQVVQKGAQQSNRRWIYSGKDSFPSQNASANALENRGPPPRSKLAKKPPNSHSKKPIKQALAQQQQQQQQHYLLYLNQRVRRRIVRSIPTTYSFVSPNGIAFDDLAGGSNDSNQIKSENGFLGRNLVDQATDASDNHVNNNTPNSNNLANAIQHDKSTPEPPPQFLQFPIQNQSLQMELIPLPTTSSSSNNSDDGRISNKNQNLKQTQNSTHEKDVSQYASFCSHHGKHHYNFNYGTHIPHQTVMFYQPSHHSPNEPQRQFDGQYVLNMPLVMGTVIGYSPPLEVTFNEGDDDACDEMHFEFESWRQRENQPLFRILWDGYCHPSIVPSSSSSPSLIPLCTSSSVPTQSSPTAFGYLEDVTLEELLPCLLTHPSPPQISTSKNKRNKSSTLFPTGPTPPPSTYAHSVYKHVHATVTRQKLQLEWKMEHELLPKLVLLAALELRRETGQKITLELQLKRLRSRGNVSSGGGKGQEEELESMFSLEYYSRHPNQYMPSFQPPPSLPSDDDDDDDDDDHDNHHYNDDNNINGKDQNNIRLTKIELQSYHESLEAQSHYAPSKLAERVKLACTMAYDYARSRGYMDRYEEQQKKIAALSSQGNKRSENGWDPSLCRRSSRSRSKVNYAENGRGEEELDQGMLEVKSVPREDVSGGPLARYLLGMVGWLGEDESKKKIQLQHNHDNNHDDHNNHNDDNDTDSKDPFFDPDPCLVIDQLGRKQRFMSPAEIQAAIVHAMKEPLPTPPCLTEPPHRRTSSSPYISELICTSGDKTSDLPQFEPASFARCRFAPRTKRVKKTTVVSEKMARLERKAERRQARKEAEQKRLNESERAYRAQKNFEIWRFKSIYGSGCALWPEWSQRVRMLLKQLNNSNNINGTNNAAASDGSITINADTTDDKTNNNADNTDNKTDNNADNRGNADDTIIHSSSPPPPAMANDEALARVLAESTDPPSKRRRTTRRRNVNNDEPVFYGGHLTLSREQLQSTIVRLLYQARPGSSSIMDLKRLVFAEEMGGGGGGLEWKKLRGALGHLLYRSGTIGKMIVDVKGDDVCWDQLKKGTITTFESVVRLEGEEGEQEGKEEQLLQKQLGALESYVRELHLAELSLRSMLMKIIDKGKSGESLLQLSTLAIAIAADEMEEDADAADWHYFTDHEDDPENDIQWQKQGNSLLGKLLFRPALSPLRPSSDMEVPPTEKCIWYKVVSFSPSVPLEDLPDKPHESGDVKDVRPNTVVQRRMRFRAIPIDVNEEAHTESEMELFDEDYDDEEEEKFDGMVLTEGQVRAGMEAGALQRRLISGRKSKKRSGHPFGNKVGSRVMLSPLPAEEEGEEEEYGLLYGVIAGFGFGKENEHRLLILLDAEAESGTKSEMESGMKSSFWCTTYLEGSLIADIEEDWLCSRYKVQMHEYHQGSEAYKACESIVSYLRNHPKSAPFLHPVNPVELDIPEYFEVVQQPMDLETVAKKLEEGKYGRIPPLEEDEEGVGEGPVEQMLYGPFCQDLMLIFDNAILFNSKDSWIGADAQLLKKSALRRMATAAKARQPKSLYVDDDGSDYEYETDEDRGSRRSKKHKPPREDLATQTIERPFALSPDLATSFPHIRLRTDPRRFSLPQDWSCRHAERKDDLAMALQEDLVPTVRRSMRARAAPDASKHKEALAHVEYFLRDAGLYCYEDLALPSVYTSRVAVEVVQEAIHELFYAKLYRHHNPHANNSHGNYLDGSFPPYLGRVILADDDTIHWEIRNKYVLPALRWVLRGLVKSGHLEQIDQTLSLANDAPSHATLPAPIVLPNHEYYAHDKFSPYDILDQKEILRKRKQETNDDNDDSEDDAVELSAYEKMRAERVARNAERLKSLGLV